jgi:hypothetical protein
MVFCARTTRPQIGQTIANMSKGRRKLAAMHLRTMHVG